MNLETEKLELIRMVIESENPRILAAIKKIFSLSDRSDFWDNLTPYQREEILKGVEESNSGDIVDYENIVSKHRK